MSVYSMLIRFRAVRIERHTVDTGHLSFAYHLLPMYLFRYSEVYKTIKWTLKKNRTQILRRQFPTQFHQDDFDLCGCDMFHHTCASSLDVKQGMRQQCVTPRKTLIQFHYCWGSESATVSPESFIVTIAKVLYVYKCVCVCVSAYPYKLERDEQVLLCSL